MSGAPGPVESSGSRCVARRCSTPWGDDTTGGALTGDDGVRRRRASSQRGRGSMVVSTGSGLRPGRPTASEWRTPQSGERRARGPVEISEWTVGDMRIHCPQLCSGGLVSTRTGRVDHVNSSLLALGTVGSWFRRSPVPTPLPVHTNRRSSHFPQSSGCSSPHRGWCSRSVNSIPTMDHPRAGSRE